MKLRGRNLSVLMSGNDVRDLQVDLRNLGYRVETVGNFAAATRETVLAFQKHHGLKTTGVVDGSARQRFRSVMAHLKRKEEGRSPAHWRF